MSAISSATIEEVASIINTTQPDEMILMNWIGALRSGDYTFGFGLMRSGDDTYDAFGVLAAISVIEWVWDDTEGAWGVEGEVYAPTPQMVADWLGLTKSNGRYDADALTFTGFLIDRINEIGDRVNKFEDIAALLSEAAERAKAKRVRLDLERQNISYSRAVGSLEPPYSYGRDSRPYYAR